jgi:hypothetical protein
MSSKSSSAIYHTIITQIKDIAYWLSTEIKNLEDNLYTTAPHHIGRAEIIFKTMNVNEKIIWALANKEFDLLKAYIYDSSPIFEFAHENRVYLPNLVEAYNQVGESPNIEKVIEAGMNRHSFKRGSATRGVYWTVDGLSNYLDSKVKKPPVDDKALEIELEDIRI